MIKVQRDYFIFKTKNTLYSFKVSSTGHLEHIYYGSLINEETLFSVSSAPFSERARDIGNAIKYDQTDDSPYLENASLEFGSYGKGDYREPLFEGTFSNGSRSWDFLYEGYEKCKGKKELLNLPSAKAKKSECETVEVTLKDRDYPVRLILTYTVIEKSDVIIRSSRIVNNSDSRLRVSRLLSASIDMQGDCMEVTSFCGGWGREMNKSVSPVAVGNMVLGTVTGTSSSRSNPLFFVSEKGATESKGEVYGFNLIYAGNHYESISMYPTNNKRIAWGMSPIGSEFVLDAGDELVSPEAVMTFSSDGFTKCSNNFHRFVMNNIIPDQWKNKKRPVLLNSWEAAYFDINEDKLLALAKEAKKVGVELFVMDDGWFKGRNDDTSSLGDWVCDKKKLPNGLSSLAEKVNELGLAFGIWVEPEMVNVKSELYKKHPDWAMEVPGRHHSEGRNQRILDLCNPNVQDYLIKAISKVISSANISYVKWDMNRTMSDVYSPYLEAEKQGEVVYRFYEGLYRVCREIMEKFPDVLFEGCSAGGNRFNLAILCQFPQIWGSDNTDAICRLTIQDGYSYGYPQSTYTSHVSAVPNHQTGRTTTLGTRYSVAMMGNLGYEINLCEVSDDEKKEIKKQIKEYKANRKLLQFGEFIRIEAGKKISWKISNSKKTVTMKSNFKKAKIEIN